MSISNQALTGKNVVVIGGGRGIGAAVSDGFRDAGSNVTVVHHATEGPDLAATDQITIDISRKDDVERAFRELDATIETLDVVVNAMDIGGAVGPSEQLATEEWRRVIDTNLSGPFWVCQEAGRRMIPRGQGSIVNVTSFGAVRVVRGHHQVQYNASKAGIVGMTQALAQEWGRFGVRVNAVAEGSHRAQEPELFDGDQARLDEHLAKARTSTPLDRLADASEIVPLVLFLGSDDSAYLTGDLVVADGGRGLGVD